MGSLLQKMTHDLRTTLSPVYPDLLSRLLKLLPRSISVPALGVLLETLSSLFKFLLVPSIHLDLLEKTWTAVRDILPTCLPEIQRAMAEVWGSVLRRLKTAAREKAVTLLAEKAEGVEDASAWVVVFACKVRLAILFSQSFVAELRLSSPCRKHSTPQPHQLYHLY
jgi:U3 small nucleolar RNA-associated protein 20